MFELQRKMEERADEFGDKYDFDRNEANWSRIDSCNFRKGLLEKQKSEDVCFSEAELENMLDEYVTEKVKRHMNDYEKFHFGDPISMHSRVALVDRGYHTV